MPSGNGPINFVLGQKINKVYTYRDGNIADEGLKNSSLCSALKAFSREGSYS
jgi:hypothetical protein